MSAPDHDPFPMRSEEAKRLAASVEPPSTQDVDEQHGGGDGKSSWHTMHTTTTVASPRRGGGATTTDDESSGTEGLMGTSKTKKKKRKSSKQKAKPRGSIYDEADEEEVRSVASSIAASQAAADRDDPFLDSPLTHDTGALPLPLWLRRFVRVTGNALLGVHRRLYGDALPPTEMLRTLCLSSTLFFMIGGYWLLRSLKDPILTALCGVSVIPKAKMASVFVVLGVVSVYNKLLDGDTPKHRLFYVFGTFYFVLFSTIALLLTHPTIGLQNQNPDPKRILGWISYCGIESFGSVMVSLFWSFANSNFSLEGAKASYGFMVASAQIGSILGPTVVNRYAASIGVAKCYFVGAICMLLLQCTMALYIHLYGTEERGSGASKPSSGGKKKEKAGVLEGIHLFLEHNYIKGIFAISCLFMVEVTIVDYTMKVLARDHFAGLHPCEPGMSCWDTEGGGVDKGMSEDATAAFTTFMGLFGQATNTLSFLLSLLGTSAVIRHLGLRLTLLLFPSLCLAVIIMVRLHPTLYVVFAAMMMLKASSYALNNPTKEMLYQPTSPAVKYKAKSWIDIFGARGAKALGSVVTNQFSDSASTLVSNGSLVGMCVATFLIWNARFMGLKFDEYTASGYIVGGEDDDNAEKDLRGTDEDGVKTGVQMAMIQNENEDTSCAIYDDDELDADDQGQGGGGDGGDDVEKAGGTVASTPSDEEEEEEENEEGERIGRGGRDDDEAATRNVITV